MSDGDKQPISEEESSTIKKALGLPDEAKLSLSTNNSTTPAKKSLKTEDKFEIHASAAAGQFFATHGFSVMATAYKTNTVLSFGATDDGRLSCFQSTFPHPMAIARSPRSDCQEVWVACRNHLVRCVDAGGAYNEAGPGSGGGGNFTSTMVPRQLHAIGTQDVHGIYVPAANPAAPFFLSTRFSALCQLNIDQPEANVTAVWKPPFVSEIRGEDRCHFNDVCFVDGAAKYASCICEADAHDGWRDHRASGGVLVDMTSNRVVARGLSMPHSPRWYKNELWLLNSGTGYLGVVTFDDAGDNGKFEPRVFVPGFLRGLQFAGRYAVVGSSLDRHEQRFQSLELGANLESKKTTAVCGLFIIDLVTLSIAHKIEIKGSTHEIYDIELVPGRRARVLGINDEESFGIVKVVERLVKAPTNDDDDENEDEEVK